MIKTVFYFLFFISLPALAQPEQELSEKLKAIKTFSAEFTQQLTDPSGDEIQTTQGNVMVKSPGLFHWQVNPPYEQLVVANQQFLWVYDADLEQVTVSDRKTLDNSPAQILSGDFSSLGEQYEVTVETADAVTRYTMKALDKAVSTFTQLEFTFDKKNTLQSMILVDKLSQITAVTFKKQNINSEISNSLFDFIAPEGVDIIANH